MVDNGRRFGAPSLLVLLVPQVQLAANEVRDCGLQDGDKGSPVHLVECEQASKDEDGGDEKNSDEVRQSLPQDDRRSHPAQDVNKLVESEGAKDFVFNLYKLGNLILHTYIVREKSPAAKLALGTPASPNGK